MTQFRRFGLPVLLVLSCGMSLQAQVADDANQGTQSQRSDAGTFQGPVASNNDADGTASAAKDPAATGQPSTAQDPNSAERAEPAATIDPDPFPAASLNSPEKKLEPMTKALRTKLYLRGLVNPFSFVGAAAGAGWGQWRNRPEEWGQGGEGFARRYASGFATHITRDTIQYGLSTAFHEDTRYQPSGEMGFGARLKYAITETFAARRDDGSRHLAISRVGALVGASFVSRTWQPDSTNTMRSALVNLASTTGWSIGFSVAHEFMSTLFHAK